MEAIRIILFLRNIRYQTKFFDIEFAETIGQAFTWSRINTEMITVFVTPCIRMRLQRFYNL